MPPTKPAASKRKYRSGAASSTAGAMNGDGYVSGLFEVKQMRRRNADYYLLKATQQIEEGTFLGLYLGTYIECEKSMPRSLYKVHVQEPAPGKRKKSQVRMQDYEVYPFGRRDSDLTKADALERRKKRPFANMNEPNEDATANCKVVTVHLDGSYVMCSGCAAATRFGCLAVFACRTIGADEEMTWHYGKDYQKLRESEKYKAGTDCTFRLEDQDLLDLIRAASRELEGGKLTLWDDTQGMVVEMQELDRDAGYEEEVVGPKRARVAPKDRSAAQAQQNAKRQKRGA